MLFRSWVARRIPDGYISGHANQSRISTFPLRDGKTSITSKELDKIFLPSVETVYSYDVISFARMKGLYPKQAPDADFSFCDTYNPINFDGLVILIVAFIQEQAIFLLAVEPDPRELV